MNNWSEIIANLRARGLTQFALSEAAETSQTSISDLARGRTEEPGHALGERILKIAKTHRPLRPPRSR